MNLFDIVLGPPIKPISAPVWIRFRGGIADGKKHRTSRPSLFIDIPCMTDDATMRYAARLCEAGYWIAEPVR